MRVNGKCGGTNSPARTTIPLSPFLRRKPPSKSYFAVNTIESEGGTCNRVWLQQEARRIKIRVDRACLRSGGDQNAIKFVFWLDFRNFSSDSWFK